MRQRGPIVHRPLVALLWIALTASDAAIAQPATRPAMLPTEPPIPLETTLVPPVGLEARDGVWCADFGQAAFGTLRLQLPVDLPAAQLTVRLGEKRLPDGTIDRKPPGNVNFRSIEVPLAAGQRELTVAIPTKPAHRQAHVVTLPPEVGEVTPFRYAEIEGLPSSAGEPTVRQLFLHAPFRDDASDFACSDPTLNAVWALCKHTMKATTAFGIYIDGERERIAYEGDAYINQLSHYACDLDPRVARRTFPHLLDHPTWPTEWPLHMPMIAEADWMASGDPILAQRHFDRLKETLRSDRARADGLLVASAIVDWPAVERDGYNGGALDPAERRQVGPMVNTVANAFYYRALCSMARLAAAIGRADEADAFASEAQRVARQFNLTFFDAERGIYIDGEGSAHASLHANFFPLAFGLVPDDRKAGVAAFVRSRGMACSVYGAQYLLEALFQNGHADAAVALLSARTDRSWYGMIQQGSTMTLEAWNPTVKPNLTWNHAWGAAPANLLSRFVLGVRPIEPGYRRLVIAPQPGALAWAQGRVPTPHGAVTVDWNLGQTFRLTIDIPAGTTADVILPMRADRPLQVDGATVAVTQDALPTIRQLPPGRHVIEH